MNITDEIIFCIFLIFSLSKLDLYNFFAVGRFNCCPMINDVA